MRSKMIATSNDVGSKGKKNRKRRSRIVNDVDKGGMESTRTYELLEDWLVPFWMLNGF